MGNAGSGAIARERQRSGETAPPSPCKEDQAFTFDKKCEHNKLIYQSSHDDEEPYFTKPAPPHGAPVDIPRPRANTVSEGKPIPVNDKSLPTVFRWEGWNHDISPENRIEGNKETLYLFSESDESFALSPTNNIFLQNGGGSEVYISGTFTGWKTIPMVRSHGDFVTIIDLPEGEHQYKFYVDGEWKHDPGLKIIDNGMGSKNNLVCVKKSDFEVFQALAQDSESISHESQKEYSQDIPVNKPWEKVSGPPILPPHLLQVILNKDTPLSCEPTLLPEPNHVMLNHLYALSIKDGVMVLSATHRYRKKYVTTLLYKPI